MSSQPTSLLTGRDLIMRLSKYLSLMTGLNRMALHSSEFAVTTRNNNNLSLSVTDQHYRYVSMKIYLIPRGSW